jgi:hypothetical protein
VGSRTKFSGNLIVIPETLSTDKHENDDERLHSISTSAYMLNGNRSTSNVVQQSIHLISTCICIAISKSMPGLSVKTVNSAQEFVTTTLTPACLDIHHDVKQFLIFAYIHSNLTVVEMIHVLFLIELYLNKDGEAILSETESTISEATLGSLLLCSLMISLKMDRDVPFTNCWFGKMFEVPLDMLNDSEISFLQKIELKCNLDDKQLRQFCDRFLTPHLFSRSEPRQFPCLESSSLSFLNY